MAEAKKNYWEDTALNLYYNSKTDFSLDDHGAKKYKKKATASGSFVFDLQTDLIAIGYLDDEADGYYGSVTKRAIQRFQRRALTKYRVKGGTGADVSAVTYTGKVDGICNQTTATEIRLWIKDKLVAPLGRFKLVSIPGGRLRSDIAPKWNSVATQIKTAGGTISSPYGDSTRAVTFRKSTGGNSLFSLHYTGRAIDLNQNLAGGKGQRYYVQKELVGKDTFWRIYCKTEKQDGSQGTKITKDKKIKYYSFWAKKEIDLPAAHYLDLTEKLHNAGFIRIRAHSNWKTNSKGQEWWHFHYDKDLQKTFQDEMELLGHNEATLRKNGWNTNAKLDRHPG